MHDLPRQKLSELVAQYGHGLCDDAKRLEGMLKDVFRNEHKREMFILVSALREGVADEFRNSVSGMPLSVVAAKMVRQLRDNLALDETAARWGVESWAFALGVTITQPVDHMKKPAPSPVMVPTSPSTVSPGNDIDFDHQLQRTVGISPSRLMQIVKYGHPALRWKSKAIQSINNELRSTIREMFELMYSAKGIGLAANQVGLPLRFFVVNVTADPLEVDEEIVFLNPRIRRRKGATTGEEGCLSLPGLYATVDRAEEIVVEAFDLDGEGFEMDLDDLPARVVQHETDHLDGVLFVDRLTPDVRMSVEPRLLGFESEFRKQQSTGEFPSDDEIKKQLKVLEKGLVAK